MDTTAASWVLALATVVLAVATVALAGVVVVTLWREHKLALFEKRFAIYGTVQDFAVFILRKGYNQWELVPNEDALQRRARLDSMIEPPEYPTNSEFLQLQDAAEQAEFLFPRPGVSPYLKEVKDKAQRHWKLCLERKTKEANTSKMSPISTEILSINTEINELLKYFAEAKEKRTKEVFRSYLQN